ncbi:MAG: hypothetical protein JNN15_00455 [Blastocatellia bacterium]|nr:hypothetical protein [Blastocatellia bacterium]
MSINSVNRSGNSNINTDNNIAKNNTDVAKNTNVAGISIKKAEAAGTSPLNSRRAQETLQKANSAFTPTTTSSSIKATKAATPSSRPVAVQPSAPNKTNAAPAPVVSNPTRATVAAGPLRTTLGTNPQVRGLLQNVFNVPTNAINSAATRSKLNQAGQTQNSTVNFAQGGSVTLFNNNGSFPPSSTATLPRNVFDQQGILSFYKSAGPLSPTQLKAVQSAFAGPNNASSRLNYAVNIANLGKNLTSIKNGGNLDDASRQQIDQAIGSLRTAYNTLSNVNAPAPDPRALYSKVANVYSNLSTNGALSDDQQRQVSNGLNILSISASNYDTNRLPVPGAKPAATAAPTAAQQAANAAAAARFPLQNFDVVRKQPLSNAQGNPAQVFGSQVNNFLQSIGVNGVDPNTISYQVNSADQLQAIQVQLQDGRRLTSLFSMGMIDKNSAQFVRQPTPQYF